MHLNKNCFSIQNLLDCTILSILDSLRLQIKTLNDKVCDNFHYLGILLLLLLVMLVLLVLDTLNLALMFLQDRSQVLLPMVILLQANMKLVLLQLNYLLFHFDYHMVQAD